MYFESPSKWLTFMQVPNEKFNVEEGGLHGRWPERLAREFGFKWIGEAGGGG